MLLPILFDGRGMGRQDGPMPRQKRIEYAGAIYHVLSRGDRRKAIFLDDMDRQDFLKTLWSLRQASERALAEALVARQLERLGWQEEDLAQRPKRRGLEKTTRTG